MKKLLLSVAVLVMAQILCGQSVVRLDPALDTLVSPDAKLEMVKNGFGFIEGINWVKSGKGGFLIFSDTPANVIDKMTPDGAVSVFLNQSGYSGPIDGYKMATLGLEVTNGKDPKDPLFQRRIEIGSNGLAFDPQGRLIICTYAGRSIDRIEKNGKRIVLADRYNGKRFGGPTDVVVKSDGAIYFTDRFTGMRGRDKDPSKELDGEGIYMLKDGKVSLAITDIATPHNLAFSPDEKYLYANGGVAKYIRRYEVQPDDTLRNGQLVIDLSGNKTPGNTDGFKVDSKGNIYSTGPGGIWIISPDGKHLGTIRTPEIANTLAFGDPDYKTVYTASPTTVYKIRVSAPGQHR
jgi:gluconolactonase